jgi:hypothetical protein
VSSDRAWRGCGDRGAVDDEVEARLGGRVHMVAALEETMIAVTKTVFESVEIDLDINHLAVARIIGVVEDDRMESVKFNDGAVGQRRDVDLSNMST